MSVFDIMSKLNFFNFSESFDGGIWEELGNIWSSLNAYKDSVRPWQSTTTNRMKKRTKYSIATVHEVIKRDSCKINLDNLSSNIGDNTVLNFTCKCGKQGSKTLGIIFRKAGAFCEECSIKVGTTKRIASAAANKSAAADAKEVVEAALEFHLFNDFYEEPKLMRCTDVVKLVRSKHQRKRLTYRHRTKSSGTGTTPCYRKSSFTSEA